jgi:hypothetical protein
LCKDIQKYQQVYIHHMHPNFDLFFSFLVFI